MSILKASWKIEKLICSLQSLVYLLLPPQGTWQWVEKENTDFISKYVKTRAACGYLCLAPRFLLWNYTIYFIL